MIICVVNGLKLQQYDISNSKPTLSDLNLDNGCFIFNVPNFYLKLAEIVPNANT